MKKLPARMHGLVFPFVLSILMSCFVSAISVVSTAGIGAGFINNWFFAWALSWVFAFPILLLILPLVHRIVGLLVETPE